LKRIEQKKVSGKQKSEEVVRQIMEVDLDTKVELVQRLIPLGSLQVQEQFQRKVEDLAEARYRSGSWPKR